MQLRLSLIAVLACFAQFAFAQATVKGSVVDNKNTPLIGVTVFEQGTFNGSATGPDGTFSVDCKNANPILVFSYLGYATQTLRSDGKAMNVVLLDDNQALKEVVISVGSRATSRTLTTTPLPVDNLTAQDFKNSGQISFNEALQYRVPSFNTGMNSLPSCIAGMMDSPNTSKAMAMVSFFHCITQMMAGR